MRRRALVVPVVFYAALVALLTVAPQVLAKRDTSTICSGTLINMATADVTVPVGAVCRVSGSTLKGSVTVLRDAYFEASATKVTGSIRASGALTVFLHDGTDVAGSVEVDGAAQLFLYKTAVGGTVRVADSRAPGYGHVQVCDTTAGGIEVRRSGPDVLLGDPAAGCLGNRVRRDLVAQDNVTASELDVSGNQVGGWLVVTGNTGSSPKRVVDNTVLGTTELGDNAAPFDHSP